MYRPGLKSLISALASVVRPPRGVTRAPPQLGALLAAGRVHVGHAGLDGGEGAGLLLAHHFAVADEDAEGAVAGIAIDAVAAPRDGVPAPAFAVAVFSRSFLGAYWRSRHGSP